MTRRVFPWNCTSALHRGTVAVAWSRLYPGLARYPVSLLAPSPAILDWGGWQDLGR